MQVPILIDALANDYDPDGDSIFFELINEPSHGEFDTINGLFWYKSYYSFNDDYDRIRYRLTDHGTPPELSNYASVIINLLPNPDVPIANADSDICVRLVPVELDILANDTDFNGDILKVYDVDGLVNCEVEISSDSMSVIIIPGSSYYFAAFSYHAIEKGTAESYISYGARVTIGILPNPDIPVTVADYAVTTGGYPVIVPVLQNDYDLQGDEFEIYSIASDPLQGTVSQVDQSLQFTPKVSVQGICSFSYKINQVSAPYLKSKIGQVYVDVSENPDRPVGMPDVADGMKCTDIIIDVLANDYDINGDALEIKDFKSGNDSITISDNKIIYYSSLLASDRETFEYRVRQSNDPEYYSKWTPVYINLEDNPAFPAAVDDHYTVTSLFPMVLSPLDNDIRNTADTLIISGTHGYSQNKVSIISDSLILYEPYTNACTRDSCMYIVSDKNNPDLRSKGWIYFDVQDLNYYDSLTINKINAGVNADGMLFGNAGQLPGLGLRSDLSAHFRYPNGALTSTIFCSAFWIGGISSNDSLHFAGARYHNSGVDFQPGPVSASYDSIYATRFWRLWKLNTSEVDFHRNHWFQEGYQPIDAILTWPGTGDQEAGQAIDLAPYYDYNLDGLYDPMGGDYPLIRGDECIFFMMNDDMDHTESHGKRLKVEVHGMVYEFDAQEDSVLSHTVFVHYDVINRSDNEYHDNYLGVFTDIDLGNPWDDYIGSDVFRNSYFCYNGRSFDDNKNAFSSDDVKGYGKYPPAQSVTILSGPLIDADASDNPSGECDFGFNGFNFGNEIVDDERYGLTGFIYRNYYYIDYPPDANDYYLTLKGYWDDSTRWEFGGSMNNSDPLSVGPACQYLFPGNSDTANFGTGCQPPNPPYNQAGFYWTDSNTNFLEQRHGLGIMGPFTFKPGDVQEIELAYVVANGWDGPVSSVNTLMEYIDSLRYRVSQGDIIIPNDHLGVNDNTPSKSQIRIYPNPAGNYIFVEPSEIFPKSCEYSIYDVAGRDVERGMIESESRFMLNVGGLEPGFYIILVQNGNQSFTAKFIKR